MPYACQFSPLASGVLVFDGRISRITKIQDLNEIGNNNLRNAYLLGQSSRRRWKILAIYPANENHALWGDTQSLRTKTALLSLRTICAPRLDNVSEHPQEHGNGAEEGSRGGRLRSSYSEEPSSLTSAIAASAATGQASGSAPEEAATTPNDAAATPTSARSSEAAGQPLRWWLEIVGAGEVTIEPLISLHLIVGGYGELACLSAIGGSATRVSRGVNGRRYLIIRSCFSCLRYCEKLHIVPRHDSATAVGMNLQYLIRMPSFRPLFRWEWLTTPLVSIERTRRSKGERR